MAEDKNKEERMACWNDQDGKLNKVGTILAVIVCVGFAILGILQTAGIIHIFE